MASRSARRGSYVRLIGVVRGSLDPGDPRNAVIVNLDRAPRNAQGRVECETDISSFCALPIWSRATTASGYQHENREEAGPDDSADAAAAGGSGD